MEDSKPPCTHPTIDEQSVCASCGTCTHDVVLNGACFYCGSTELPEPSPEPNRQVVPIDRLRKR